MSFARVAGREMSEFTEKKILLLGKVQSASAEQVTVTSADNTTVTVQLDSNADIVVSTGSWYQFKGTAKSPSTMFAFSASNAGDGSVEIDVDSYLKLCELWNGKQSGIFKP
jgi:hypothetical protein